MRVHASLLLLALAAGAAGAVDCVAQSDEHRYVWTENGHTLEVRMTGEVRFADDDASVRSLSPGAVFRVEERGARVADRAVELRAAGGEVARRYWRDGRETAFDAEASRWLAEILPRVLREMGIGAEERVARLYARGGAEAVLREVEGIRSDGGATRHLRALVRHHPLSAGELTGLLRTVERQIGSDGDRARLLREIAERAEVDREGVRPAFFAAVDGIGSDGDHARVLTALLTPGDASDAMLLALLESAALIGSDGDKARVMMRIPQARLRSEAVAKAYLETLRTIGSDGDRARVAMRYLESRS